VDGIGFHVRVHEELERAKTFAKVGGNHSDSTGIRMDNAVVVVAGIA